MKKIYLFLFLIFPFLNYGQTINLAPKIGDSYITQAVFAKDVNEGNTGKNQIWDMLQLVDSTNPQPHKNTYLDVKNTPFSLDFPKANLATKIPINDSIVTYNYFNFDADQGKLFFIGSKVGEPYNITIKYADEICSFQYPINYSDEFKDTFYSDVFTTPINYGNSFSVADASGTLKLKDGNFEVLRIKTTQEAFVEFGVKMYVKTKSTSYTFYTPSRSYSLLTITYTNSQTIEKKKKKEKIKEEKNSKIVTYSKPSNN